MRRFSSGASSVGPRLETVKDKRTKWTLDIDLILIKAWQRTTKDSIKGASQDGATFWGTVTSRFVKDGGLDKANWPPRSVKSHWNKCAPRVQKYVNLLRKEKALDHSGWDGLLHSQDHVKGRHAQHEKVTKERTVCYSNFAGTTDTSQHHITPNVFTI